jgi:hypothetical protein
VDALPCLLFCPCSLCSLGVHFPSRQSVGFVQRFARTVGDYQHKDFKERTESALRFGGPAVAVNLLIRALAEYDRLVKASAPPSQTRYVEETIGASLVIVRELTYSSHSLANTVYKDCLPLLLSALKYPPFFDNCLVACEEVLSFRMEMFPVSTIGARQLIPRHPPHACPFRFWGFPWARWILRHAGEDGTA